MSNVGVCALCGNNAPLLKSHAVPKFVLDWMKRTGATDYVRNPKNPNLRRQDFETFRMLCLECEGRFSRWEKQFCEQLYVPFQTANQQAFHHNEWLLRFTVSLAWRTLWRTRDRLAKQVPHLMSHVDAASDCWRDFLLEKRPDAGPYEHHMFFFEYLSPTTTAKVPDKYHAYTVGAADSTSASTDQGVWAYTKLPGLAFWSAIHPTRVPGWKGGLITRKGFISPPREVRQSEFVGLLHQRIEFTAKGLASISDTQHQKIRDSVMANPDRAAQSRTFQTFLADSYWKERREAAETEASSS